MVLGVLFPVLAFVIFGGRLAAQRIIEAQVALLANTAPQTGSLGCRTDVPWSLVMGPVATAYGYDALTRTSTRPEAPPLPEGIWNALSNGRYAAQVNWPFSGGILATRSGASGTCSVLAVHWRPTDQLRRALFLAGLGTLAVGLTFVVGFTWVLRPTLKRLARLAQLAPTVGTTLTPASTVANDEIGGIEQALYAAHHQIVGDRARLEESTHALERFLLELGHDLKTPLASLSLSIEEWASQHPHEPGARSALAELVYLELLVENLRLEARLRQGGLRPNPAVLDLKEVVETTVRRFQPFSRRTSVRLEAALGDEPVMVTGDRTLLERGFSNLVHNAVAHGARHVAVILSTTTDSFEVAITNDGPGLEAPSSRRGEGLGGRIAKTVFEEAGFQLRVATLEEGGVSAMVTGLRETPSGTQRV
jgi:signal transduction histidine kinase